MKRNRFLYCPILLLLLFYFNESFALTPDPAEARASLSRSTSETSLTASQRLKIFYSKLDQFISNRSSEIISSLFNLNRVKIEGAYRISADEYLDFLGVSPSTSIVSTSPSYLKRRILEHPWVEKADFSFQICPLEIGIKIRESDPWIVAEYDKHSWIVSTSGRLIQPTDSMKDSELIEESTELVRLDGLDSDPNSESYLSGANARLNYAIQQIKFLQSEELPFVVQRYTLLPDGSLKIVPEHNSQLEIILRVTDFDQARILVGRLRSVLIDLERRTEKPKKIDLRFDRQVVVQ